MPQVVINNFPHDISTDPFNVDVLISGAKSGTNYLRVELYKDGTDNYFGETFNGQNFYGGTDGTQYFPIQIKTASTSATIQARIGNPNSGEYSGPGIYDLKIKRYTQSGNAADDTENNVQLQINYNLETSTPTVTQEPISTGLIYQTPMIVPISTQEGVINYTPTNTPYVINTPDVLANATVTGSNTELINQAPTKAAGENNISQNIFPIFPAVIFAAGLFLIGIAAYLIYTGIHARKNSQE